MVVMNHFLRLVSALFLSLSLSFVLFSCGGSSSAGNDTTAARTGTVGILLTDQPADPSLFVSINASIDSAVLIGENDDYPVSLYEGPTKVFDLLRLRNEAIPFTFQDGVPVGSYCKIRLVLSDLELVLADDTPDDLTDNETYHPHLPGNGKLDLVARDCFDVGPGEVVTLQLDIDAGNSIHIVDNKKGFNFRPVVFVDVLNQEFDSKLVRLQGEISEVDAEQGQLLLCGAIPVEETESEGCVEIHLGEDSAFFDNQQYEGAPRALSELLVDDKVGEQLTVVGWPRYWVQLYMDVDVSEGHYPPAGECRLWNINLEPGQQDAPIDCADVPDMLPEDMVLVTHDGVAADPYHPLMVVDALALELGEFMNIEGTVATDADNDGFTMTVSSGGPVIEGDTLGVLYQTGEDDTVNGTRIVSKSGELLGLLDVMASYPVQVDGTEMPVQDGDSLVNAALVIVDTGALATEQVTGTVISVDTDSFSIDPDADMVCGVATVQLTVPLSEETEILTVTITDEGSEILPGGTLEAGQMVGMNGNCTTSGYQTDNIVIVVDER
jgi:hypothetical protein